MMLLVLCFYKRRGGVGLTVSQIRVCLHVTVTLDFCPKSKWVGTFVPPCPPNLSEVALWVNCTCSGALRSLENWRIPSVEGVQGRRGFSPALMSVRNKGGMQWNSDKVLPLLLPIFLFHDFQKIMCKRVGLAERPGWLENRKGVEKNM